jgi:integrase
VGLVGLEPTTIGLFAGLRVAEIKALDWKDVDLARAIYPCWGENLKDACAPARAHP